MSDGQTIILRGEGGQQAGVEPGDMIIVLKQIPHEKFERYNENLVLRLELQFVEALCSFQKSLTTLDNREIVITVLPVEVVKHGAYNYIVNESMPRYHNASDKGHLILQFIVNFPEKLPFEIIPLFERYLPARPETIISDQAELEVLLFDYDIAAISKDQNDNYSRMKYVSFPTKESKIMNTCSNLQSAKLF